MTGVNNSECISKQGAGDGVGGRERELVLVRQKVCVNPTKSKWLLHEMPTKSKYIVLLYLTFPKVVPISHRYIVFSSNHFINSGLIYISSIFSLVQNKTLNK